VVKGSPQDVAGGLDGSQRRELPAAFADGAALPVSLRLRGVLSLSAALPGDLELVGPCLDVTNSETIEPLAAKARHDVQADYHLVQGVGSWPRSSPHVSGGTRGRPAGWLPGHPVPVREQSRGGMGGRHGGVRKRTWQLLHLAANGQLSNRRKATTQPYRTARTAPGRPGSARPRWRSAAGRRGPAQPRLRAGTGRGHRRQRWG
jgi:hypothetical protein